MLILQNEFKVGVKLAREYVQYLKDEIKRQEESNQLKIDYMKKLKNNR